MVTVRVSQGSTLGPLSFNVYADDLHAGLEDVLSKFAGETRWGGAVASTEGGEDLQRDVDKSENWVSVGTKHQMHNV